MNHLMEDDSKWWQTMQKTFQPVQEMFGCWLLKSFNFNHVRMPLGKAFLPRKKHKLGLAGYTTPLVFATQKTNDPSFIWFITYRVYRAIWCELILTELAFLSKSVNILFFECMFWKINSLIIIFERLSGRFLCRRKCKLGLVRCSKSFATLAFSGQFPQQQLAKTKNNCI